MLKLIWKVLSDVKSGKISENEALKIMAKLQQNPSQLEEVSFDDNNIIIKYFQNIIIIQLFIPISRYWIYKWYN